MTQWTHLNDQPHTPTKAHNLYTITNHPYKSAGEEESSWTDWSSCYRWVTQQTGQVLQLCHWTDWSSATAVSLTDWSSCCSCHWTDWSTCYSCVIEQTGQLTTAVSLNRLVKSLQLCHWTVLSATEPAPTIWGYACCVSGGISDHELMPYYLTRREVGVPIGRLSDGEFWKCAHSTSQGVIIQSVLKTSSAFLIQ